MKRLLVLLALIFVVTSCKTDSKNPKQELAEIKEPVATPEKKIPFVWDGANIYFLLTDRFNNGNLDNDLNFDRSNPTGKLRGFMGGDIQGITKKIQEKDQTRSFFII